MNIINSNVNKDVYFGNFLVWCLIIIFVFHFLIKPNRFKLENFADPYSIDLHTYILNKTQRWNLYNSRKTSSVNYKIAPPIEWNCWYQQY
jgi:hypothetical protein